MATDERPMVVQELLETRGSRKTGANSKTSTATRVDRGELAVLLAECQWAEEHQKSTDNPRTTPTVPKWEGDGELEHVVVARQDAWVNSSPCDTGMISRFSSAPKRGQLFSRCRRRPTHRGSKEGAGVRNTA